MLRIRAVFKWLSKVITWLRLLRLVIGLKESRQFFNQWESKPKPIAPCTRDFSRASSELQVVARNCDWFIALSAPVVIGWSNCFGFGFSTVNWKPLQHSSLAITSEDIWQMYVNAVLPYNHIGKENPCRSVIATKKYFKFSLSLCGALWRILRVKLYFSPLKWTNEKWQSNNLTM